MKTKNKKNEELWEIPMSERSKRHINTCLFRLEGGDEKKNQKGKNDFDLWQDFRMGPIPSTFLYIHYVLLMSFDKKNKYNIANNKPDKESDDTHLNQHPAFDIESSHGLQNDLHKLR